MSLRHLAEGSTCPPLAPDQFRVYSMKYCPHAEYTRLVLEHKSIPYELVNVNLKHKPEWLFEVNPKGLVPVLQRNDQIICESAVCNQYLEDLYPEPSLTIKDPYLKAKCGMLSEHFAQVISVFWACIYNISNEHQEQIKRAHDFMSSLENQLTAEYFGGEQPCMLDFRIWPWLERFPACAELLGTDLLPADRFPKMTKWTERMLDLPAVKAVLVTNDDHLAFLHSYRAKNSIYDPVPESSR